MIRNFMRFRKLLFIDTLNWDLPTSGDLEQDQFDHDGAEYGLLLHKGWIVGGFRATPTHRSYLSRDVFGHLASDKPLPRDPAFWEISRFGVMTENDRQLRMQAALANYAMMFDHAQRRGASGLIALADLPYERFLRKNGIATARYGKPQRHEMGSPDNAIDLVVGEIPLNRATFSLSPKFKAMQQQMEFYDELSEAEDVRGREAVSA